VNVRHVLLAAAALVAAGGAAHAQPPGVTLTPPYIEAMTWTEIRDALAAGKKTIIIPVGGTEQNGPHMILGKHNYIIAFNAKLMAERLGNALVAPTIAWVPEGGVDAANKAAKPGIISHPGAAYNSLLDAAARSLRAGGFTEILLIGDSGGNQSGMTAVADSLNKEWTGSGVRVFALVDYYNKARADMNAWLTKEFGYDSRTIGSHAGILDTSQLMYIWPQGVRKEKIAPNGGSPDSGVNGDPTKATPEIGKQLVDFKVNAAIDQYKRMKAAPPGER
jgi:creatinine amidohydrolase/Fe(II)-dependent formamide hydrolase-like protein